MAVGRGPGGCVPFADTGEAPITFLAGDVFEGQGPARRNHRRPRAARSPGAFLDEGDELVAVKITDGSKIVQSRPEAATAASASPLLLR